MGKIRMEIQSGTHEALIKSEVEMIPKKTW